MSFQGPGGPSWLAHAAVRARWLRDDARFRSEPAWAPVARGTFEVTAGLAHICRAPLFAAGRRTPVIVRFAVRDEGLALPGSLRQAHGFDVRFDSPEAPWHLPASNIPVAWLPDPARQPMAAANDCDGADEAFWRAVAAQPAAAHRLLWRMSDWSLPRSLRMMDSFADRHVTLVDARGRRSLARFHWRARLGPCALTWEEAVTVHRVAGNYLCRDLCETIASGDHPVWLLGMQLIDPADPAATDRTRIVPETVSPLRMIGRLTLNGCFDVSAALPEGFDHPPVTPGLEPPPPAAASGGSFDQARILWRSSTIAEQAHIVAAFALAWAPIAAAPLRARLVDLLWEVDDRLAWSVAARLDLALPARPRSGRMVEDDAPDAMLSIERRTRASLEGKLVGMLVDDGTDGVQLRMAMDEAEQAGATPILVSPAAEAVRLSDGDTIAVDGDLVNSPAAIFDGIAILLTPDAAARLAGDAAACRFVADAFRQCKGIAVAPGSWALPDAAQVQRAPGVVDLPQLATAAGRRYFDREAPSAQGDWRD